MNILLNIVSIKIKYVWLQNLLITYSQLAKTLTSLYKVTVNTQLVTIKWASTHPRRLISAVVIRFSESFISKLASSEISIF